MLLAVEIVYYFMLTRIDEFTSFNSIITLLITVPVGVLVYLFVAFKTKLADEVLGERADKIRAKLRFL